MNWLCLLFSVFLLASCASIDTVSIEGRDIIHEDTIKEFNGVYKNASIDSTKRSYPTMWMSFKSEYYGENWEGSKVRINFKNSRKAEIELIDKNEKIIKQSSIKGKLDNGYFYVRRKFMIYPFIPLVFGYTNKKSRFCLYDGYLHIDSSWNIWGFAVANGTDEKKEISYRCEKISNRH